MNDLELPELPLAETLEPPIRGEADKSARIAPWGSPSEQLIVGVRCGVLVGINLDGRAPLVVFPGQKNSAAVAARATLDLHESHIGREVVLMFEDGDRSRPIIVGCLSRGDGEDFSNSGGQVEVDADGERLIVSAREQLVLRCGKATITLTKAGKILIQGEYISSRSTGVNRISGGSVQIN